jgi:hypothetical protein
MVKVISKDHFTGPRKKVLEVIAEIGNVKSLPIDQNEQPTHAHAEDKVFFVKFLHKHSTTLRVSEGFQSISFNMQRRWPWRQKTSNTLPQKRIAGEGVFLRMAGSAW